MGRMLWLVLFFTICLLPCHAQDSLASSEGQRPILEDFDVNLVERSDDQYSLIFRALLSDGSIDFDFRGDQPLILDRTDTVPLYFIAGRAVYNISEPPELLLVTYAPEIPPGQKPPALKGQKKLFHFDVAPSSIQKNRIPLWVSILPPLLAILMALWLKEVIVSLVAGIWLGSYLVLGLRWDEFFNSLLAVADRYIINSVTDPDHAMVIIFSLFIGGMVAIISRNGGMAGIVQKLSRYASSSRNATLITWFLGVAIFFDDYANTLIVGNTMRPVTDRFRVSREKLAYIVDSTAAPVAAIAFVTTWIGAELGYIGEVSTRLGLSETPYTIFFNSLQYAFYPILTLLFILFITLLNRDFGSMRKAELRARESGEVYSAKAQNKKEGPVDDSLRSLDPVSGIRYRWANAFFPILTVLVVTITGMLITGYSPAVWQSDAGFFARLSETIGNADAYISLIWGSFLGLFLAIVQSTATRTLSFKYAVESMMDGFKTMLPAVIILVLAWSLAAITNELHTADYLTSVFSGNISPFWMPLITFILAATISFSTGSSWSTMAILYPLVLPTTWTLCMEAGIAPAETMHIFYNVTAVVLGGSVFGDHCSPISDTTVLSSLASGCNHIDHVRTQLPYALVVGVIAAAVGGLVFLIGLPWYADYGIGILAIFLFARYATKPVPVMVLQKGQSQLVRKDSR